MPATETTRKSKKKATRRPRSTVKKISVEDHKAEMKAATEAAIAKAKEEWDEERRREEAEGDFGISEDDDDDLNDGGESMFSHELDEEEGIRAAEEAATFNIFDWTEKEYVNKGIPVLYEIRKNGTIMGTETPPCSWDDIQARWRGGHYTITAKHAIDKTYIKKQTLSIADGQRDYKESKNETVIQQPPPIGLDPTEMMKTMTGMFSQMQEIANKERRNDERDERRSSESFNTTFLTLMQDSQRNSQEMFLKLQESTNKVMEKLGDSFSKALEKQDDKMNKMFEKLSDSSSNKDNFTTAQLIEMMQNSETKGMDIMKMVLELSEARAESLAEAEGSGDTKEGLLVQTMKGFLPLLAKANQASAIPQHPAAPQYRRPLPQKYQQMGDPKNHSTTKRGDSPLTPVPPHNAPNQQAGQRDYKKSPLGLPSITDKLGVGRSSAQSEASQLHMTDAANKTHVRLTHGLQPNKAAINEGFIEAEEAEEVVENDVVRTEGEAGVLYEEASITQRTICEIAIPSIADHLLVNKKAPKDSAILILSELESQGFSPQIVAKEFPLDLLIRIARSFQLGQEHDAWLGDFHAEIQSAAGDDVDGASEPAISEPGEAAIGFEG